MLVSLIGYGEVGRILAEDLRARGAAVSAYDLKLDTDHGQSIREHAATIGVVLAASHRCDELGIDTAQLSLPPSYQPDPLDPLWMILLDLDADGLAKLVRAVGFVGHREARDAVPAAGVDPLHRRRILISDGPADVVMAAHIVHPGGPAFQPVTGGERLLQQVGFAGCQGVPQQGHQQRVIRKLALLRGHIFDHLIRVHNGFRFKKQPRSGDAG